MGTGTEPGLRYWQKCLACGEKIEIICTGADLVCCPYCRFSLEYEEGKDGFCTITGLPSLEESIVELQRRLLRYRNSRDQKDHLLHSLQHDINDLNDRITLLQLGKSACQKCGRITQYQWAIGHEDLSKLRCVHCGYPVWFFLGGRE